MKQAKVLQVKIQCMLELKQHLLPLAMPAALSALALPPSSTAAIVASVAHELSSSSSKFRQLIYIPMPDVYQVEGACLTGPMQIQWMGQLMKLPRQFVLHIDSKFKLHHGEWVLTSLGTHCLRWDPHHLKLSTTFVPLVYLMCKQHESAGAALLPMDALNVTTLKYFDGKLVPGACMSDHCVSFRTAYDKDLARHPVWYMLAAHNSQMVRGRVREQEVGALRRGGGPTQTHPPRRPHATDARPAHGRVR